MVILINHNSYKENWSLKDNIEIGEIGWKVIISNWLNLYQKIREFL